MFWDQETMLVQRDFLAVGLPQYGVVAAGRDDGKEAGEMTAVFYRRDRFELLDSGHFWLSETPEKPGSKSWDTSLTRMATWLKLRDRRSPSSSPILAMNTHFDHMGKQARLESAMLLRRRAGELGAGCSIVIMGDFNCTETEPPYAELAGQTIGALKLIEVYRALHQQPLAEEATFQGFDAAATRGKRIDFIFATDDLKPETAAIDRNQYDGHLPSDHFPVTIELIVNK